MKIKKIYKVFKVVLIDLIIGFYVSYTTCFIFTNLTGFEIHPINRVLLGFALSLIGILSKRSLGWRLIFKHKKGSWKLMTLFLFFLTFLTGWLLVEIRPIKFFAKFSNANRIIAGLFNPDFTELKPMLTALAETVYLAFMATALAVPIAFIISFLGARNLMSTSLFSKVIYTLVRTIATVIRSIEALVWAIIFSVWVGIGPFAGMLALMFHSMAALVKLYSEQIENIDYGPIEALKSTGANRLQIWIYGVIPQIINPFLAFTIYRWDINVRMATIVGFVGGGGIGLALHQQQQLLRWRNVGLIMWLIALVVWSMDMISGKIREKLLQD